MPLTNAEKQKAHRRRMAEKMARMQGALERIAAADGLHDAFSLAHIAEEALNPTEPAKS